MRLLEGTPAGLQSNWEHRRQAWEHLGAPRIAVEQSAKNNIFLGNAAGAPGNQSHYLSFNDF